MPETVWFAGERHSVWCLYLICPCRYLEKLLTLLWFLAPNSHRPQIALQISPKVCLRGACVSCGLCKNCGALLTSHWDIQKSASDFSIWAPWCNHACSPDPLRITWKICLATSSWAKHSSSLFPEFLNSYWILSHGPTKQSWYSISESQLSCLHYNSTSLVESLFGQ